jgi:hypothetical protein
MKKFILLTYLIMISCGEPLVELDESLFEEKIVVEAFLEINKPANNIRISRNFPLKTEIDFSQILLTDAIVVIDDLNNPNTDTLTYNPTTFMFEDNDNDFGLIKTNNSYRIYISATVNGKVLITTSTCISPAEKLEINLTSPSQLKYYANSGNDVFKYDINTVSNSLVYVSSLQAKTVTFNNLINRPTNVFISEKLEEKDFEDEKGKLSKDIDRFINKSFDLITFEAEIRWWDLNFYSEYQLIVYAGDQNYKDYIFTYRDVQGQDGNLKEPKFNFKGDGIGIFTILTADTIELTVNK